MAIHLDNIQHIILISAVLLTILPSASHGLWLFQQQDDQQQQQQTSAGGEQEQQATGQELATTTSLTKSEISGQTSGQQGGYLGSRLGLYGTRLLSIAGIQPASIASLLNTVGDTSFRYFNIQDQCRNRAACDLGFMLYKKLSFVHNWLIRTSVRTLTDMNNIYSQSWMEGMLGRNCTAVYSTCRESPLEGLMNLAMLQQLAISSGMVAQANAAAASANTAAASGASN